MPPMFPRKPATRRLTYRALIDYLKRRKGGRHDPRRAYSLMRVLLQLAFSSVLLVSTHVHVPHRAWPRRSLR